MRQEINNKPEFGVVKQKQTADAKDIMDDNSHNLIEPGKINYFERL